MPLNQVLAHNQGLILILDLIKADQSTLGSGYLIAMAKHVVFSPKSWHFATT